MSTRLHIVVSEELVAQIDAARHEGQPRADWIRRAVERVLLADFEARASGLIPVRTVSEDEVREMYPAVEQALGEQATSSGNPKATGVPVASGVEGPAPAEQPERPNLRGAYEVAAKGGLVGELFQAAADSVAAKPAVRQHAENCKCPVCS